MAIGRKPSGAYEAAYPVTLPDGTTGYAGARVIVDQNGNPVSGSGGAVTIADGADVAEGATTAAVYTDQTGATSGTVVGLLKGLYAALRGTLTVVGNAASGASDSGAPVKAGGVYSSTTPTVTSGQRVDLQTNQRGVMLVQMADQFNQTIGFANGSADAQAASANGLQTNSRGQVFNGTSWDRQRGDTSGAFIGADQFWTESATALAASATLNGTLRANGGAAGGIGSRFAFFIAEAFSDVAGGTLFIDKTVDGGTTYRQVGSIALVANSSVSLKVPISAPGYRARVVNGSTAQTAALVTSAYSLN